MLQWRGGGRTIAHNPAALSELGYLFAERAGIVEFDGGLDRADAERLAWEHLARQHAIWEVLDDTTTRSRGPTEHWRPPPRERYER